jgi:hypothetical protein
MWFNRKNVKRIKEVPCAFVRCTAALLGGFAALNKRSDNLMSVGAVKVEEHCEPARGCDFIPRALVISISLQCRPIKVSVRSLNQGRA